MADDVTKRVGIQFGVTGREEVTAAFTEATKGAQAAAEQAAALAAANTLAGTSVEALLAAAGKEVEANRELAASQQISIALREAGVEAMAKEITTDAELITAYQARIQSELEAAAAGRILTETELATAEAARLQAEGDAEIVAMAQAVSTAYREENAAALALMEADAEIAIMAQEGAGAYRAWLNETQALDGAQRSLGTGVLQTAEAFRGLAAAQGAAVASLGSLTNVDQILKAREAVRAFGEEIAALGAKGENVAQYQAAFESFSQVVDQAASKFKTLNAEQDKLPGKASGLKVLTAGTQDLATATDRAATAEQRLIASQDSIVGLARQISLATAEARNLAAVIEKTRLAGGPIDPRAIAQMEQLNALLPTMTARHEMLRQVQRELSVTTRGMGDGAIFAATSMGTWRGALIAMDLAARAFQQPLGAIIRDSQTGAISLSKLGLVTVGAAEAFKLGANGGKELMSVIKDFYPSFQGLTPVIARLAADVPTLGRGFEGLSSSGRNLAATATDVWHGLDKAEHATSLFGVAMGATPITRFIRDLAGVDAELAKVDKATAAATKSANEHALVNNLLSKGLIVEGASFIETAENAHLWELANNKAREEVDKHGKAIHGLSAPMHATVESLVFEANRMAADLTGAYRRSAEEGSQWSNASHKDILDVVVDLQLYGKAVPKALTDSLADWEAHQQKRKLILQKLEQDTQDWKDKTGAQVGKIGEDLAKALIEVQDSIDKAAAARIHSSAEIQTTVEKEAAAIAAAAAKSIAAESELEAKTTLLKEKEALALRKLDEEYKNGNISEADYAAKKKILLDQSALSAEQSAARQAAAIATLQGKVDEAERAYAAAVAKTKAATEAQEKSIQDALLKEGIAQDKARESLEKLAATEHKSIAEVSALVDAYRKKRQATGDDEAANKALGISNENVAKGVRDVINAQDALKKIQDALKNSDDDATNASKAEAAAEDTLRQAIEALKAAMQGLAAQQDVNTDKMASAAREARHLADETKITTEAHWDFVKITWPEGDHIVKQMHELTAEEMKLHDALVKMSDDIGGIFAVNMGALLKMWREGTITIEEFRKEAAKLTLDTQMLGMATGDAGQAFYRFDQAILQASGTFKTWDKTTGQFIDDNTKMEKSLTGLGDTADKTANRVTQAGKTMEMAFVNMVGAVSHAADEITKDLTDIGTATQTLGKSIMDPIKQINHLLQRPLGNVA
ncbi:hypothetical protein EPO05_06455 [Patescibacteria group bacterium]|nr:MAG: hypothetical protein EPO05_06455 [Patescibacteria group bacterium]